VTFDARDIHPPLDVFSHDNVYLGTVLAVRADSATPDSRHSLGRPTLAPADQTSTVSGELLGPMPTEPLGNPGPANQSARSGYRADGDGAPPLGSGTIVVGRWWGLVGRRAVPLDQVLALSLERVTLMLTAEQFQSLPGGSPR